MEDNKIWRVENMESVHDDSEIDESKNLKLFFTQERFKPLTMNANYIQKKR